MLTTLSSITPSFTPSTNPSTTPSFTSSVTSTVTIVTESPSMLVRSSVWGTGTVLRLQSLTLSCLFLLPMLTNPLPHTLQVAGETAALYQDSLGLGSLAMVRLQPLTWLQGGLPDLLKQHCYHFTPFTPPPTPWSGPRNVCGWCGAWGTILPGTFTSCA